MHSMLLVCRLSYLQGVLQLICLIPIHKFEKIFTAPTVPRVVLQASRQDLDPLFGSLYFVTHQNKFVLKVEYLTTYIPLSHFMVSIEP